MDIHSDRGRWIDLDCAVVAMNILDPRFRYVPAAKTNLAATFRRIRREIAEREQATQKNVTPMKKVGK